MKVPTVAVLIFVTLDARALGTHIPREFVDQAFHREVEERHKLEKTVGLSEPALQLLLKGLATLMLQLYPDVGPCPPHISHEEPIKIFRQIMQLPGTLCPGGPAGPPEGERCAQPPNSFHQQLCPSGQAFQPGLSHSHYCPGHFNHRDNMMMSPNFIGCEPNC